MAQQSSVGTVLLVRVILPLTLLAAAVFRYNAVSCLYLLLLLCTPFLSTPTPASMRGLTGKFLLLLIPLSVLPIIGHIVFHVTLVATATDKEPYGHSFQACSSKERLVRQIGFQRLDSADALSIIRLVVLDALVFIVSIVTFVVSRKVTRASASLSLNSSTASATTAGAGLAPESGKCVSLAEVLAACQNLMLALAGTMAPSLLGSMYLLVFFLVITLWGCHKSRGLIFGPLRLGLLLYTACHILTLYLYQFQFFQDYVSPSDFVARLLGLTGVVRTDCSDLQSIHFHSGLRWWVYVNPGVLLVLYWALALSTRLWRDEKRKKKRVSRISRRSRTSEKQVAQPSAQAPETGSMVFSGSTYDIDVEDEAAENERLVDSEVLGGGQYGGVDNPNESSDAAADNTDKPRTSVPEDSQPVKRKPLVSVLLRVEKQSYVLSLMGMMAWSIAYHSWLTFVLLLVACVLWMMPDSRKWSLRTSPAVLLYAVALVLAQFVFCMDLRAELPSDINGYPLDEIGMKHFLDPCPNLMIQILFTSLIVTSLRQWVRESNVSVVETQGVAATEHHHSRRSFIERLLQDPSDFEDLDVPANRSSHDSQTILFLGRCMWLLLCKNWIIFCTVMLAVISLQEVVVYRIIYMILFILFLLTFQLSFTAWRKTMRVFWWVVVIYSMLVLTLIYTFQFEHSVEFWRNTTGFSDNTLKDIGLEKYGTAELFVKLLTPTIFVIIVILQVRYFHIPFLKLTALDRFSGQAQGENVLPSGGEASAGNITEDEADEETKKDGTTLRNWTKRKILELSALWVTLTDFLWRLAEIHIFKLIVLVVIIVATDQLSALTFVYVLLLALFLPCSRQWLLLSHLVQIWSGVVVLARMIFQLRLVPTSFWITHCGQAFVNKTTPTDSPSNTTGNTTVVPPTPASMNGSDEDNAAWFGLVKIHATDMSLVYYERLFLLIMFLVALQSAIRYRQQQHYNSPKFSRPRPGILFPEVMRPQADEGLVLCIKYFANYFFYKFGLECCFVMTAITISVRVDAVSVIYTLFMWGFLCMKRVRCARLWPLYKLVLAVMLPVQFLEALGFPLGSCLDYPWDGHLPQNLGLWLYLPNYRNPPDATNLIVDTLQLLLVCLQSFPFLIESNSSKVEEYGGGDNSEILEEVERNAVNPVEDFTIKSGSTICSIKSVLFEYMFWVTMAIVFMSGVSRINIFSLIYVISVFAFMWYGSALYLKPLRKLLKMWSILVMYTVFVMCLKALLQLLGCVYIQEMSSSCAMAQLIGVNCLLPRAVGVDDHNSTCVVEKDDAGLKWDVVCFIFLLLQRRIFSSHYFRHVADMLHAQTNLTSRGAEIINRIMIREVNRQKQEESKVLDGIKEQMTALKVKQASLKKDFKEPEEHFQAIRAGDYYLFDEKDEVSDKPTSLNIGKDSKEDSTMNPLQVINTATDQGADAAIEAYNEADAGDGVDGEQFQEEKEVEPQSISKIRTVINLILTVFYSILDWIIRFCNRLSYNYRLVAKQLATELVREKNKIKLARQESLISKKESASQEPPESDTVCLDMTLEHEVDYPTMTSVSSIMSLDQLEKTDQEQICLEESSEKNRASRLVRALVLLLVSHSELLCYFLMILSQMVYGSLLSLPLPLMVFLWGMLSVPRPSKTFWVSVITYTEAVVVCKYVFQFGFFPWNKKHMEIDDSPFFPPRIIGIEQRDNYANVDIALLLALFLHRYILRKYGLWRDSADISADLEAAGLKEKSTLAAMASISEDTDQKPQDNSSSVEEPAKESKVKQGLIYVTNPFTKFFKQVTQSSYNATVDVYARMFFCDFILFLVLVFGFPSFGPADTAGSGDVTSYIQDNKIPVPFLVMLILQFVFIVVDRALFLRKLVLGKFIFQIILVIVIHIWMFFVLPVVTQRSFYLNTAAQMWYFIKCVYFGLSAYQIRCGYPSRIQGNFLTKNYGYVNLFLFKGFLMIPFLLELRALMDWIWTDTTLAIGSWLQMEDIYANIFQLKCWREIEKKYPTERSVKKGSVAKYVVGGLLLIIIIFIIWFPLVFFSFFNSVFQANPPLEAQVSLGIRGYQPLVKTSALGHNIRAVTDGEYRFLKNQFSGNQRAYGYLSGFEPVDVSLVTVNGNSLGIWGISSVSQQQLINDLLSNSSTPLILTLDVQFRRDSVGKEPKELTNSFEVNLKSPKYNNTRLELAALISKNRTQPVRVNELFPRYLRLGKSNEAKQVDQLLTGTQGQHFSNISLQLQQDNNTVLSEWWNLFELLPGPGIFKPHTTPTAVPDAYFITFNDRKAPDSLSFLSGYGIIGLYISFILLIGRLLRISTTNQSVTIMFRELPDVNKVLNLLLDLYLVREMKDFQMEEDLYAKLIFLYRSPDTLVKYTRQTIRLGTIKKKED